MKEKKLCIVNDIDNVLDLIGECLFLWGNVPHAQSSVWEYMGLGVHGNVHIMCAVHVCVGSAYVCVCVCV